jgi:hypothetical protein
VVDWAIILRQKTDYLNNNSLSVETISIPVSYKGQEISLAAQILRLGYVYKIRVLVNEVPVVFERDEEGEFRAVIDPETGQLDQMDIGLVQAISEVLVSLSES